MNATENSIIGYTNVFLHLSHSQFAKGEYESNLANLITDVMYDYVRFFFHLYFLLRDGRYESKSRNRICKINV